MSRRAPKGMTIPGKANPMAGKRRGQKVDGWVILDKPVGMTSTQAVGAVRRVFEAAKAGHGGTLDPLATGLLPIALGEATKTVPYVMDGMKTYRFTLRFGEARATDDAEGEVSPPASVRPEDEAIRAGLPAFCGRIQQRPPIYSALKVAGQRAYDLARAGEAVDLAPREILIERFELIERPDADHAVFEVLFRQGGLYAQPRPGPRRGAGDRRPCGGAAADRRRPLHRGPCNFAGFAPGLGAYSRRLTAPTTGGDGAGRHPGACRYRQ